MIVDEANAQLMQFADTVAGVQQWLGQLPQSEIGRLESASKQVDVVVAVDQATKSLQETFDAARNAVASDLADQIRHINLNNGYIEAAGGEVTIRPGEIPVGFTAPGSAPDPGPRLSPPPSQAFNKPTTIAFGFQSPASYGDQSAQPTQQSPQLSESAAPSSPSPSESTGSASGPSASTASS